MVEVKKAELIATYWGATEKRCPFCAETIPVDAGECRWCKASFDDRKPLAREDVIPDAPDPRAGEWRGRAKWLLFFSLLGFAAPVTLLVAISWIRSDREEIDRAGGTARALIYSALGISLAYLAFLALGLLAFRLAR
jgi:hypothetical protein